MNQEGPPKIDEEFSSLTTRIDIGSLALGYAGGRSSWLGGGAVNFLPGGLVRPALRCRGGETHLGGPARPASPAYPTATRGRIPDNRKTHSRARVRYGKVIERSGHIFIKVERNGGVTVPCRHLRTTSRKRRNDQQNSATAVECHRRGGSFLASDRQGTKRHLSQPRSAADDNGIFDPDAR